MKGFQGFRSAPLLLVFGEHGDRSLVVGRWVMWLEDGVLHAEAGVHAVWHEGMRWRKVDHLSAAAVIVDAPPFVATEALEDSPAAILTTAAKAAADRSRSSVTAVREVCYQLADTIAEDLRPADRSSSVRTAPAVPEVMAIRAALSLARDEARETVRRQFELGSDDREAYERYRRAADPTLMIDYEPADHSTRAWMRTHDAGIRQCRAIWDELGEQIDMLSGTLDAASTMWTAQQAKSTHDLNRLASAAAIGIGSPSLVLAYYGADQLLDPDLQTGATVVAWLPIVLGAVPAAILLRDHRPEGLKHVALWQGLLMLLMIATVVAIGSTARWALS